MKVFYIEGVTASAMPNDVRLSAHYYDGTRECIDTMSLTVADVAITQIRFVSDHGVIIDNDDNIDYSDVGLPFDEPEWLLSQARNAPISHTLGIPVEVDIRVSIIPQGLSPSNIGIQTAGLPGFEFQGFRAAQGGNNDYSLISQTPLPERLQHLETPLDWSITGDTHWSIGRVRLRSGPHEVFATFGPPRDITQLYHSPTLARFRLAFAELGTLNSLNPHEIVEHVLQGQGAFDLDAGQENAWWVPDRGGDCHSIVRFTENVSTLLAVPGVFERKNIYAIETAPTAAIEVPGSHRGLNDDIRYHPAHPNWELALKDTNGGANAFEAVAKLTACGETRYYAGGTDLVFLNKDDVLTVFERLAWGEGILGVWIWREDVDPAYAPPPANPPLPTCNP